MLLRGQESIREGAIFSPTQEAGERTVLSPAPNSGGNVRPGQNIPAFTASGGAAVWVKASPVWVKFNFKIQKLYSEKP